MSELNEVEELANRRCLEFIKSVGSYSDVKSFVEGIYLQGCKDMAKTLIENGYSKPLPVVGVKWPSRMNSKTSLDPKDHECADTWNACHDAFMSEIAKQPRLKEIEEKELAKVLSNGFIKYVKLYNQEPHGTEQQMLAMLAFCDLSHFGTRVLSEDEIEKVITPILDGWDLIKDGGPKQLSIAFAKAIKQALEGR